jgi:hypothetical protein
MPEQLFGLEMLQGGGQHTAASRVADAIMICVFSAHWSFGKEVAAGRGSKHHRAAENPHQRPVPDCDWSGLNLPAVVPHDEGRD